jgi:MFS family permease
MPREVRRLVLAHGLSATAMGLPWPALLIVVWDSSHSDVLLGVAATARLLPYVLFSWLAGRLADRMDRLRVVRLSLAARVILLGATAALASTGQIAYAVVAAALVVTAGTPAYPAMAAAMPRLADRANETATGVLVTLEVAAFFVGPALGGLILGLGVGGWMSSTVALVATGIALAIATTAMRSVSATATRRATGAAHVVPRAGQPRVARAAIAAVALDNAVAASLAIALLPLASDGWHSASRQYGLATAAVGVGAFAAPILLNRWGIGVAAGQRSALVLAAVLVAIAVSPALALAALPLAAFGAASVHVEAVSTALIQAATPNSGRSAALGLADSVMVGAAAVAAAVTPLLCTLAGGRAVIAAAALPALALRRLLVPMPSTARVASADGRPAALAA